MRVTWADACGAAPARARRATTTRTRGESHGISRSSSAALSDLPCGSSASVAVTPPPARALQHEVQRPELRQLVADHRAGDQVGQVGPHPLGGDLAREARVVGGIEGDHREVDEAALVAGAAVRDRPQHHVRRPPADTRQAYPIARHEGRGDGQHLAVARWRRRRRTGRWCRAPRPRCRCDRLGAGPRARGDAQPHLVRLGMAARPRRAVQRVDADQVAADGVRRTPISRRRSSTIAPARRARAAAPGPA